MSPCVRAALSLLAVLSAAAPAWTWGREGHRIVALIAEQRLSPEARARVRKLLLNGQFTLAQASTCPDALRAAERVPLPPEEEYCLKIASVTTGSAPWHYIDIPVDGPLQPIEAYCPHGACVTDKIVSFAAALKTSTGEAQRREALMYLTHFVGDIHQPLHCAERRCDQGGNLEFVNVYLNAGERPGHRLHGAWDTDFADMLMEQTKLTDEGLLAGQLGKRVRWRQAQRWIAASVDEMAWEGWRLAKNRAYPDIPDLDFCDPEVRKGKQTPTDLDTRYEATAVKTVREQLTKAGVRLAALIEANLTQ